MAGSRISLIEYYLPEGVCDNLMLAETHPEWNAERFERKVGIHSRHVAGKNETAADLAYAAAEKLLIHMDRNSIDFLLFCTQSPDHYLPTTACLLQQRLGLPKNIGALDYNLGCSGYVYGLALAKGLIAGGIARKVLLLTGETYSKYLHSEDLADRAIFGDGAAATLVETSEEEHLGEFVLRTDGSGGNNLVVRNGMARSPRDGSTGDFLYMNGPEIFNFTLETLPPLVNDVLCKNNLGKEDVNHFIFHQANRYMLNSLQKLLEIPEEKFYINLHDTGNTVSSTIPIALKQAEADEIIKPGDKILLAGFGVGYSYGATIITL